MIETLTREIAALDSALRHGRGSRSRGARGCRRCPGVGPMVALTFRAHAR